MKKLKFIFAGLALFALIAVATFNVSLSMRLNPQKNLSVNLQTVKAEAGWYEDQLQEWWDFSGVTNPGPNEPVYRDGSEYFGLQTSYDRCYAEGAAGGNSGGSWGGGSSRGHGAGGSWAEELHGSEHEIIAECNFKFLGQEYNCNRHWYNIVGSKWKPALVVCTLDTGFDFSITEKELNIGINRTSSRRGEMLTCLTGDGNCWADSSCM